MPGSIIMPGLNDGTERFSYSIPLDNVNFTFDFMWNSLSNFWSFILLDSSNDIIITRKLVVETPLLIHYVDSRLPTGDIFAVDTSNQDLDPGLYDLGDRVLLLYLSVIDIPL